jgi:hypothetical protein
MFPFVVPPPNFQNVVQLMRDADDARKMGLESRAERLDNDAQESARNALKAAHSPEPHDPEELAPCLEIQIYELSRVAGPPLMSVLTALEERRSLISRSIKNSRSIHDPAPTCPHS